MKMSPPQTHRNLEGGLESIAIPHKDNVALHRLLHDLKQSAAALALTQKPTQSHAFIRRLKKSKSLPPIWKGWSAAVQKIGLENVNDEIFLHNGYMDELRELPESLELEAAMAFMNARLEKYGYAYFGAFEIGRPEDLNRYEATVSSLYYIHERHEAGCLRMAAPVM